MYSVYLSLLHLHITHEDYSSFVFLIISRIVLDLQRNKDAVFLDFLKIYLIPATPVEWEFPSEKVGFWCQFFRGMFKINFQKF